MFKKKWQQPLIFPLEVDGKVWDRQEAGQKHHIAGIPNRAVGHQVHYTKNNNARVPSDVAKGTLLYPTMTLRLMPDTNTYMVAYGIQHYAERRYGYDLTYNLPDSATVRPLQNTPRVTSNKLK